MHRSPQQPLILGLMLMALSSCYVFDEIQTEPQEMDAGTMESMDASLASGDVLATSGGDAAPLTDTPEQDSQVEGEDIAETNACGGTAALGEEPGAPCGSCGRWACDGRERVTCAEEPCPEVCEDCARVTCRSCRAGCSCYEECGEESCEEVTCEEDSDCHFFVNSAEESTLTCEEGARCVLEANSVEEAKLECKGGAYCELDCNSVEHCHIDCKGGEPCLGRCNSVDRCHVHCDGAEQSCGDGVYVCNRDCP